jgi:hypothetical protein
MPSADLPDILDPLPHAESIVVVFKREQYSLVPPAERGTGKGRVPGRGGSW